MNTCGLIVARGGSKGIPGKNLKIVAGKPLIHWPILAAAGSKITRDLYLSTDSQEIVDCCNHLQIDIPFIRPPELAKDDTPIRDVVMHFSNEMSRLQKAYKFIALLQPTSPLVTSEIIDNAITLAEENNADTVVSLVKSGHNHPRLMYFKDPLNAVRPAFNNLLPEARRQDENEIWIRTGLVYIIKVESLISFNSIYGKSIFGLEVPYERSLCIDEPFDLEMAEFLLNRKHK